MFVKIVNAARVRLGVHIRSFCWGSLFLAACLNCDEFSRLHRTKQATPEVTSEATSEATSEVTSEATSVVTSEATSEATFEPVMINYCQVTLHNLTIGRNMLKTPVLFHVSRTVGGVKCGPKLHS